MDQPPPPGSSGRPPLGSPDETPAVSLTGVDLARMRRLGGQLAALDVPQLVIGLAGTLGAGKTTLVQSLAEAHGIPAGAVTSPTFTLVQQYAGMTPRGRHRDLLHLDTYRVSDLDEWVELGVDESLETPDQWMLIEWAERFADWMPPQTLWLKLLLESPTRRTVRITGGPDGLPDWWDE